MAWIKNKKVDSKSGKIESIFLKGFRPFIWLFGICFLLYFRAIFFNLSHLDDSIFVLDNYKFNRDLRNIPKAFTTDAMQRPGEGKLLYRPLLTLSFMSDAQFGADKPAFYHFTNIIIHILSTCLVFVFLQKLKVSRLTSFLLSLIFAVHPVLSQAVAWIPGRNDSLLTLFTLPSFIFFIEYLEKKKVIYIFLHLSFFLLALFTKETAIMIPILIVFYLVLHSYKLLNKRNIFLFVAWFGVSVFWFFLRNKAVNSNIENMGLDLNPQNVFPFLAYFLVYIGKIVLPFNLTVAPILKNTVIWPGIISFIALLAIFLVSRTKVNKLVLFGTGFFLLFFIPAFLRPNKDIVQEIFEHRIYLPFIGFLIAISQLNLRHLKIANKFLTCLYILMAAILIIITSTHISVFKNREAFWTDAVKHSPDSWFVHSGLGVFYSDTGNLDKARLEFSETIKLNPLEATAYDNLGFVYMEQGKYKEAESEFLKAIDISSTFPTFHNNLGFVYLEQGKYKEAESEFFKEIDIYPNFDKVYVNLGYLYLLTKQYDKVEMPLLKALEINPMAKNARIDLYSYYSDIGQSAKALEQKTIILREQSQN